LTFRRTRNQQSAARIENQYQLEMRMWITTFGSCSYAVKTPFAIAVALHKQDKQKKASKSAHKMFNKINHYIIKQQQDIY